MDKLQAPWVVLGAGPVLGLIAGWGIALLILWSGWTSFYGRVADALRPNPWFPDSLFRCGPDPLLQRPCFERMGNDRCGVAATSANRIGQ